MARTDLSRKFLAFFAAGALLAAAKGESGSLPPGFEPHATLTLVADGQPIALPVRWDGLSCNVGKWSQKDAGGNWSIEIQGEMNPDPAITYTSSVTDENAPSTFGFIYQQAIVPTAAPATARNTFSAEMHDGGTDGVHMTPNAPPAGIPVDSDGIPEAAVVSLSLDGGFQWMNAGVDLGPATSSSQSPLAASAPGPAPSGNFYNTMRIDVNFTLSGGNDEYTFSGVAAIGPDGDGDGVPDEQDNCPALANADQADSDGNGVGDACEPGSVDGDGDGVADSDDECPGTANGEAVEPGVGCSIDQLCPCSGPRGQQRAWKNHGEYNSCVAKTSGDFEKEGLISEQEKDAKSSAAAGSQCGKAKSPGPLGLGEGMDLGSMFGSGDLFGGLLR